MFYNKTFINKDTCFQVNSDSFALSEAPVQYTLYASISCYSSEEGSKAWADASGSVPAGWKAVSDPIPAGTQHNIYDNVHGTFYHLDGLSDGQIITLIY